MFRSYICHKKSPTKEKNKNHWFHQNC